MKLKSLLLVIFSLGTLALSGCGTNADGLNGSVKVTATVVGSVITGSATYTNPTQTNLIGQPMSFAYQIGNNAPISLGEEYANNSGSFDYHFTPASFIGSQTITVIATAGKLKGIATVSLTGSSLSFTPPVAVNLTTILAGGTRVPFAIEAVPASITVSDPFGNNIQGHGITITTTKVSTNPDDTLTPPTVTTTSSAGTATFPSATGILIAPTTVGGVETMTITWKVVDSTTGLYDTGITTITLTKTE